MKETHEFRVFSDFYHLLPQPNNAKFNGMMFVLKVSRENFLFRAVERLDEDLRQRHGKALFGFWDVRRRYTKKELTDARLFRFSIDTAFEPTGEECGTFYDETVACEICGANRKQIGPLILKKGSIPKKDIARTIAGEVVVSQKFATAFEHEKLKGAAFEPLSLDGRSSGFYQLVSSSPKLELTDNTVVGHNVFNLSTKSTPAEEYIVSGRYKVKFEEMTFRCPNGHTLGARLLSEPYVLSAPALDTYDLFESRQKIGAKAGLLRPEPVYLCSPAFRKMVINEKLRGFDFEIAHIE